MSRNVLSAGLQLCTDTLDRHHGSCIFQDAPFITGRQFVMPATEDRTQTKELTRSGKSLSSALEVRRVEI